MLAVVAGTAQVEQSANYRPEARGVRDAGTVPDTAGARQRWVPTGAAGQRARGAAARVVRSASRRAGSRQPAPSIACSIADFRGARLLPIDAADGRARGARRETAKDLPREATLDARAFGKELQRLIGEFRDVTVAELLLTSIEPEGSADPPSSLRTTVRYDIVGGGTKAYRVEHVGVWDMGWRRGASGWQVVRLDGRVASGQPRAAARSSPRSPTTALGALDSFRRQLTHRSRLVDGDLRLGPHA